MDRQEIVAEFDEYSIKGAYPAPRRDGGIFAEVLITSDMWWMMCDHKLTDLTLQSSTLAERTARAPAREYVDVLREGVTGFKDAYLPQTGPQIGIRESCHPPARHEPTGEDLLAGRRRRVGVARAAWPIEDHSVPGCPVCKSVGGEGFADIPLDCLRAKGLENPYFAGRTMGADEAAYASVRVMGTAFVTGEAAGCVAEAFAS